MGNSQSISLLLSYGIDDTVMSSDLNAICLIIWTISLMLMIMYCICKVMNYYILLLALLIVVIKMFCVLLIYIGCYYSFDIINHRGRDGHLQPQSL